MRGDTQRRREPGQASSVAADKDSTTSDAEALAVGRAVLGLLTALGVTHGPRAPNVYTQHRPPPNCTSSDAFLRLHREQFKAGTPGWTRSGQVRSVTAEAWEAHTAAEGRRARTCRLTAPVAANDLDSELDRELGIRTRRHAP